MKVLIIFLLAFPLISNAQVKPEVKDTNGKPLFGKMNSLILKSVGYNNLANQDISIAFNWIQKHEKDSATKYIIKAQSEVHAAKKAIDSSVYFMNRIQAIIRARKK